MYNVENRVKTLTEKLVLGSVRKLWVFSLTLVS